VRGGLARCLGVLRRRGCGLAFGAAAETMLQSSVELAAQLGILGTYACQLSEQLPDQCLQGGHVVGQRCGRDVEEASMPDETPPVSAGSAISDRHGRKTLEASDTRQVDAVEDHL
jgi:hypothetical protein